MSYFFFFQTHLKKFRKTSQKQAQGCCPLHEDKHPSFSCHLETGLWKCHGCEQSGNAFQLAELLGVEAPVESRNASSLHKGSSLQEVNRYTYLTENGRPHLQVRRYLPKTFRQFRWENGEWKPGLRGLTPMLYNLPEILKASVVYLCEGEKDCETLKVWGIPATTNPGGALKWRNEFSEVLRGKSVVMLPDTDDKGREHADLVVHSLLGRVKEIKLVWLPQGKDISEWKRLGGNKEKLANLVKASPLLSNSVNLLPKQSSLSSLNLTNLRDLLAEPEASTDWIVEGLLTQGGLSLIVAKPKVGKSTLTRQLALAVARGEEFLGRKTTQGKVIYLALEERRTDVRSHFKVMGASDIKDEIKIFAEMAPQEGIQAVRRAVEVEKPSLVIIDTLARIARIRDLNDYSQTTSGLEPFLAMAREVNVHVCLLHHAKKGEVKGLDSALGSTGIAATVDTLVFLHRSEKYRTIFSIQRTGEDLEETVLSFDSQTRISSLGGSREQAETNRLKGAILEFLGEQKEAVPEKVILEEVEGKLARKKKALRQMVENDQVERYGAGKRSQPYLYQALGKVSGSLVPHIGDEPENQKRKSSLNPQKQRSDSGSQSFSELENTLHLWEQVFPSQGENKSHSTPHQDLESLSFDQLSLGEVRNEI